MTNSESAPRARYTTGVPGMDVILQGGLLSGSVYIIRGTPGAGKTITANQICFHRAQHAQRCLYITLLSESHDRFKENLQALSFYSPTASDNVHYQSGFHSLEEEGLKGILRMLVEEMKRLQAEFVVLDGLFVLQERVNSERDFRLFLNQLQNVAHLTGATVLLLTNSDRGTGSPEYTMVDGWLELAVQQHEYRVSRFLQVHKLRGSGYLDGQHALTISEDGVRAYPRLESTTCNERRAIIDKTRLTTGIVELDEMFGGGFRLASSTLIVGPTGVGKTVYGLHFISQCSPQDPGLMFGFYESREDLIEKADALGICDLRQSINSGALEVLWHAATEHSLDFLAYTLIDAVRRRGVKRLFLDGIDALIQATVDPDRLSRFLAALNNLLRAEEVTAVFTLETPELIGGDARVRLTSVSAVAQNIILLRYLEFSSRTHRTISVVKSRTSRFDPSIREFDITENGVAIGATFWRTDDVLGGHSHPKQSNGDAQNE